MKRVVDQQQELIILDQIDTRNKIYAFYSTASSEAYLLKKVWVGDDSKYYFLCLDSSSGTHWSDGHVDAIEAIKDAMTTYEVFEFNDPLEFAEWLQEVLL